MSGFRGLGFRGLVFRVLVFRGISCNNPYNMENQMDKKIEHEMESGIM